VVSFPSFVEDDLGISLGTRSWDMMRDTWICTTKHPHRSISTCSRHKLSLLKMVKILVHGNIIENHQRHDWNTSLQVIYFLPCFIGFFFGVLMAHICLDNGKGVDDVDITLLSNVHSFMWGWRV
jgi:hypothetical protein